MKKLLLIILLTITTLNAYTIVLKDNSMVKGELLSINEKFTQMQVNGKGKNIPNYLIKKRFYTAQELAEIERTKQLEDFPPLNINEDEENSGFGIKMINPDESLNKNSCFVRTNKFNLLVNFDTAPQLNTTITYPDNSKSFGVDNQDYVFSLGAEYSEIFSGKTRYSLGALYQFDRNITSGKYSSNIFYARLEHPFDPQNENNFIGLELNFTLLRDFVINSTTITNFHSTMGIGFALYDRKYFNNLVIETGIRSASFAFEGTVSGIDYTFNSNYAGLYFITGLTF